MDYDKDAFNRALDAARSMEHTQALARSASNEQREWLRNLIETAAAECPITDRATRCAFLLGALYGTSRANDPAAIEEVSALIEGRGPRLTLVRDGQVTQ